MRRGILVQSAPMLLLCMCVCAIFIAYKSTTTPNRCSLWGANGHSYSSAWYGKSHATNPEWFQHSCQGSSQFGHSLSPPTSSHRSSESTWLYLPLGKRAPCHSQHQSHTAQWHVVPNHALLELTVLEERKVGRMKCQCRCCHVRRHVRCPGNAWCSLAGRRQWEVRALVLTAPHLSGGPRWSGGAQGSRWSACGTQWGRHRKRIVDWLVPPVGTKSRGKGRGRGGQRGRERREGRGGESRKGQGSGGRGRETGEQESVTPLALSRTAHSTSCWWWIHWLFIQTHTVLAQVDTPNVIVLILLTALHQFSINKITKPWINIHTVFEYTKLL